MPLKSLDWRAKFACSVFLLLCFSGLLVVPNKSTLTFSSIYCINLPNRIDRQALMATLARAMNLNLTFIAATPASSDVVSNIMSHVREERQREGFCGYEEGCEGHKKLPKPGNSTWLSYELRSRARGWTEHSLYLPDAFFHADDPQQAPLGIAGADLWPTDPVSAPKDLTPLDIPALNGTTRSQLAAQRKRLASCDNRPSFTSQPSYPLPWWRIVSPGAVACWHSHVQALRRFVRSGLDTALILEDDVDIEIDLDDRLKAVSAALPARWDLLALGLSASNLSGGRFTARTGHCWSNESAFEPVNSTLPSLRPANAPKCSHGYAVSRDGAFRLLRHLRSPAYAYSRAFDQALAHLIVTDRIRAFSVVPSVVVQVRRVSSAFLCSGAKDVQTRDTSSDVAAGIGSAWRDSLIAGALARLRLFTQTPTVALL